MSDPTTTPEDKDYIVLRVTSGGTTQDIECELAAPRIVANPFDDPALRGGLERLVLSYEEAFILAAARPKMSPDEQRVATYTRDVFAVVAEAVREIPRSGSISLSDCLNAMSIGTGFMLALTLSPDGRRELMELYVKDIEKKAQGFSRMMRPDG